jgi:hypothetical protein
VEDSQQKWLVEGVIQLRDNGSILRVWKTTAWWLSWGGDHQPAAGDKRFCELPSGKATVLGSI